MWEVGRGGVGVFTGGSGQLSPSSEQDGAMGRNKATRWGSGLIGPASARGPQTRHSEEPCARLHKRISFSESPRGGKPGLKQMLPHPRRARIQTKMGFTEKATKLRLVWC